MANTEMAENPLRHSTDCNLVVPGLMNFIGYLPKIEDYQFDESLFTSLSDIDSNSSRPYSRSDANLVLKRESPETSALEEPYPSYCLKNLDTIICNGNGNVSFDDGTISSPHPVGMSYEMNSINYQNGNGFHNIYPSVSDNGYEFGYLNNGFYDSGSIIPDNNYEYDCPPPNDQYNATVPTIDDTTGFGYLHNNELSKYTPPKNEFMRTSNLITNPLTMSENLMYPLTPYPTNIIQRIVGEDAKIDTAEQPKFKTENFVTPDVTEMTNVLPAFEREAKQAHIAKERNIKSESEKKAKLTDIDKERIVHKICQQAKLNRDKSGGDVKPVLDGEIKLEMVRRGRPIGSKTKVRTANLECIRRRSHLTCMVCHSTDFSSLAKFTIHCIQKHDFGGQIYCGFCRTIFPDKNIFVNHVVTSTKPASEEAHVQCPFCINLERYFNSKADIYNHLESQHKGLHACPLPQCGQTNICNVLALVDHISVQHMVQKEARCSLCSRRIMKDELDITKFEGDRLELDVEVLSMQDVTPEICPISDKDACPLCGNTLDGENREKHFYRCVLCFAGFSSQTKLTKHTCTQLRSLTCPICEEKYLSKKRLVFHLQSHVDPDKTKHCDQCDITFTDETKCYDHIRFQHETEELCCHECGKTFITRIGLSMHRIYHSNDRKFCCSVCGKKFLNRATLNEHCVSHLKIKPYQCEICGKFLSRASRLRIHLKKHALRNNTNVQLVYRCEICKIVTYTEENVRSHIASHHIRSNTAKYKPIQTQVLYRCEFCDGCFSETHTLHEHRVLHNSTTNENPFMCSSCGGSFATYSRLATHKLTHGINTESATVRSTNTKVHPTGFIVPQFFCCSKCNRTYENYTTYNVHMKHSKHKLVSKDRTRMTSRRRQTFQTTSAAPTEPRVCQHCSRTFDTETLLRRHLNEIHPTLMRCHRCDKQFTTMGWLKAHMRKRVCV